MWIRPDSFWGIPGHLSNGYWVIFPGGEKTRMWNWTLSGTVKNVWSFTPIPRTFFRYRDNFTSSYHANVFIMDVWI